MAPTMKKPTAWNSVFAQMRIWKRDCYKSKEEKVKEEVDTDAANLNFDEKLRIDVANMNFESEKTRQTIKVVDGKVDELFKLLMAMQRLVTNTDEAFVLASTAISELRTSAKKIDVKVGVAQHAGDTAAERIALLQQQVDIKLGKVDDKMKTTIQRLMNAQIGSAGAIEDKLISICTQLVAGLEERMMSCLDLQNGDIRKQETKARKTQGKKGGAG